MLMISRRVISRHSVFDDTARHFGSMPDELADDRL
jgi:hypothetical protein